MKKQSPKNIYISKGEYQLGLRQLEKSLLQTLNDEKARILDDERIITALETQGRSSRGNRAIKFALESLMWDIF